MAIKNVTIWKNGKAWKVSYARSLREAEDAIAHSICSGSIGATMHENDKLVAQVERIVFENVVGPKSLSEQAARLA